MRALHIRLMSSNGLALKVYLGDCRSETKLNMSHSHPPAHPPDLIAVERAIAEMRAARPVRVRADGAALLCVSVDALDEAMVARLSQLHKAHDHNQPRLILSTARLRRLGHIGDEPASLILPQIDHKRIITLALAQNARLDAPCMPLQQLDVAALTLATLSFVLPALIIIPSAEGDDDPTLLEVRADDIHAYRAHQMTDMRMMARAPVPLEGAPESEFVIFRGGEGMRDQVAIVIGKPDLSKPVLVRLHSACLTGDLFGSLKCDCGDQLRHTARFMAEKGGGILLYLDQEGRGNGLANKIRAYRLQAQGFDTYDADEVLGFDHDQRRFAFAAVMLKQLGALHIRVMTNNPVKIKALQDAGLNVVADERILGRATEQNMRYLASKRDRAGHMIDMDEIPLHGGSSD
jgi:GTP cyclohydrolase II